MFGKLINYATTAGWLQVGGEILIIYVFLFMLFRLVHGTRGAGVLRGLVFLLIMGFVGLLFVVKHFQLYAIEWLMSGFLPIFIVPIVVILQPEFRRALVRIGQNPFFRFFLRAESTVTGEIARSVDMLARRKIGALIAVEREIGLGGFIEGGVSLDCKVSADLIVTVFYPGTPLHDGAIVIRDQRIAAAGCLFPLSENPGVATGLGTRHRAALGVTEETDALAIVVSEETGTVSVAMRGEMTRNLDGRSVRQILDEFAVEEEPNARQRKRGRPPQRRRAEA